MADVERLLKESGAMLEGHFLLTSGRHSPIYWEKFRLLEQPSRLEQLCRLMVEHFSAHKIELVAGPTLGGAVIAFEVARQLGIRAAFAERRASGRTFRRGLGVNKGERVLVVDDVLTTGGSVTEVIAAVKQLGGQVIGVGVLVDRSEGQIDLGISLYSCHRAQALSYLSDSCPLCQSGIPLINLGGDKAPS
jgi:orotate phosphoribosyltransferase